MLTVLHFFKILLKLWAFPSVLFWASTQQQNILDAQDNFLFFIDLTQTKWESNCSRLGKIMAVDIIQVAIFHEDEKKTK